MSRIFSKRTFRKKFLVNEAFKKSKVALSIEWVARLDGASQAWELSSPLLVSGSEDFSLSLDVNTTYGGASSWISIFSGTGFNLWFSKWSGSIGEIKIETDRRFNTGIYWLEGEEVRLTLSRVGALLTLNYNNQNYSFSVADGFEIDTIGEFGGGDYIDGYVRNLALSKSGILTNELPLTNKSQGTTQLSTVGSINAFMPNYSSDVWEVRP